MGALDCVTSASKISPTESKEIFTTHMASNTTLNEQRRDVEAQSPKSYENIFTTNRHSILWNLVIDIPIITIVSILTLLFELGVLPTYKSGFFCNDPNLSFPFKGDTVSAELLISISILMPLVIIYTTECMFIDLGSAREKLTQASTNTMWLYRTYCYGLFFNFTVVEIMKAVMGKPRPSFFDLCQPDTARTCNGSEYVPTFNCTSTSFTIWTVTDSYHSFPSGHTSISVYFALFMCWYLQQRAFSWKHRSLFIVPFLQLACLNFAIISSLTRVTDHRHHWWDVLFGSIVGAITTVYAAYILCNNFSFAKKRCEEEELHPVPVTRNLFYGRNS